ncbi:MAG: methyltransferase domain-containing protein [Spirochaetales bacterium]|nr:methyltransferase domain-containing protein [Spirochaetales bacterium]
MKSIPTKRVLFVPNLAVNRGWGHWRRCTKAASQIGPESAVLAINLDNGESLPWEKADSWHSDCRLLTQWPAPGEFSLIVVDQQVCSSALYQRLRSLGGFLVGWDEGGHFRADMDYLVDSLPNLAPTPPNQLLVSLALEAPPTILPEFSSRQPHNILVVFGGGDPQGLTVPTIRACQKLFNPSSSEERVSFTVVRGPGAQFPWPVPGIELKQWTEQTLWDKPQNLADKLADFDVVLGSWGLTTLEALARGVPVALAAPTSYHAQLQRKMGLASFNPQKPRTLANALGEAVRKSRAYAERTQFSGPGAAEFWKNFLLPPKNGPFCPVCGSVRRRFLARTSEKSYFRCRDCQMEYMLPFQLPAKQYSSTYFFEEYQRQYGKTYLEDFDAIAAMGQKRIAYSQKSWGSWKGLRLLDIGCAYGPFLKAAQDEGAIPFGWDISPEAAEYVRTKLGFPAVAEAFPGRTWAEVFPGQLPPQVVTLWYVIEHFSQLSEVLEALAELLPEGGRLALGTPNGKGISRRFSSKSFWQNSPDDHFTIWNPRNARAVLRRFGFRVVGVRITGHHPERFPGVSKKGLGLALISLLDRWLGWGDTFEIYAVKEKSCSRSFV